MIAMRASGNVPLPLPMEVGCLAVGFIIMAWIAIQPRRALLVLFFRQRAVRELPEGRVRLLRALAAFVAVSVLVLVAGWVVSGVEPL